MLFSMTLPSLIISHINSHFNSHFKTLLAETSFCWAFSISSMIRHSLNYFLGQLAKERPMRFDMDILVMAIQHLNSTDFHKKLRRGFSTYVSNEF